MTDVQVPVLIVGGGGAGFTASMLLSKLDVESLLVSALPTTSILPKAHVLRREIGPRGAVLVRPDRFVAWRSLGAAADPAAQRGRALAQVLGR